ncbi:MULTISPECIES: carbohydrate ABC transporter permease [Tepidanaerobacter]|uniref:Multiple sugar transport system permease protein n=2 Tax=Tepidanaerobacter syntrophicus TaxID=224999 RepID=A0A0U9HE25_9FIRM|nr:MULTISPECIES: carbohydrate ABC transporter permease [Tepidanaerobacter]GAQ24941.1 multiple sugar transport system permease protein [Tepidanaerobacter syntrophicus]GLI19768.1 sugar ABC transporter permease [Tepidanaerobacter syntrophicus]GLI51387.1 sugar ABC transporter permease [Tepidanaerobacter syntrophicus]
MPAVNKKILKNILFYVGLIVFLAAILFPFLIMFVVSIKTTNEAIQFPPTFLPKNITFEHYKSIFNPRIFPFLTYFKNSMYVSVLSSFISVALGILGGYSLSKLKFMGKTVINNGFYLVYMFSGILLVVPLFKIISAIGLYNHREALIITMIVQTLPTSIYMLKSYFDTIPVEIEEAGRIDGLNRLQVITYIIIPLSLSGIVSVFVYAFMVAWNDFLFASIFLSSSDMFTLSIGLNSLFNRPDYIWGRMMASAIVTSIPVVLMYGASELLMRKGATEGGVKG